jgi:hypothetical protein
MDVTMAYTFRSSQIHKMEFGDNSDPFTDIVLGATCS